MLRKTGKKTNWFSLRLHRGEGQISYTAILFFFETADYELTNCLEEYNVDLMCTCVGMRLFVGLTNFSCARFV